MSSCFTYQETYILCFLSLLNRNQSVGQLVIGNGRPWTMKWLDSGQIINYRCVTTSPFQVVSIVSQRSTRSFQIFSQSRNISANKLNFQYLSQANSVSSIVEVQDPQFATPISTLSPTPLLESSCNFLQQSRLAKLRGDLQKAQTGMNRAPERARERTGAAPSGPPDQYRWRLNRISKM